MTSKIFSHVPLSFILLSSVMIGCKNVDTNEQEAAPSTAPTEQPEQSLLQQKVDEAKFLADMTPDPPVNACEYQVIEQEFDKRIFRNALGTVKLKRPTFKFTVESLRNMLNASNCPGRTSTLLLIHYGLDEDMELTYGLGTTCAQFQGDRPFEMPSDFYTVTSGAFTRWDPAQGGTWLQVFGNKYTEQITAHNVYINRQVGSSTNFPYDALMDTRYMVYPVDRVLSFLQDNEHSSTGKQITHVELVSYAALRDRQTYHHGVALLAWAGNEMMLDGSPHTNEFDMRAANLGSPCPQNCNKFVVRSTGLSIPGC